LEYTNRDDQILMGLSAASKSKGLSSVAHYRAVLRINPDVAEALNNLAWLLASHPDPKVRDGAEAVKCAERACEVTQYNEALLVGTLAAAYAENKQFDHAHKMAEKAIAIAQVTGQNELVAKNRDLLKLYDSGKPYHETAE
jgi:tetratricopeptide (TPR) repeat protein